MGVVAFQPMLRAGYDTRVAAGVITAGGTLGILIPPSIMIIVYAAVAGQSVVKLYAAAMFPGFFLAFLYLLYVIGWSMIQPKVAPRLPPAQQTAAITPQVAHIAATYSRRMLPALLAAVVSPARALRGGAEGVRMTWLQLLRNLLIALTPLLLAAVTLGAIWWYVTIYSQKDNLPPAVATEQAQSTKRIPGALGSGGDTIAEPRTGSVQELPSGLQEPPATSGLQEPPTTGAQEPSSGGLQEPPTDALPGPPAGEPSGSASPAAPSGGVQEPPGSERAQAAPAAGGELQEIGGSVAPPSIGAVPPAFYAGFAAACLVVLMLLVWYYAAMDAEQFEILRMLVSSVMPLTVLTLVVLGVILFGITTATESAAIGAAGAFLMAWQAKSLTFQKTKEAVFLTAKTTAMVCWLFVGSALFSAVFALLGGQRLIEQWVMGMDLSPTQFLLLSQALIFVLGWPLEWTEIIVIFIPIFLPLLAHFQIDPLLVGVLVFVNLQAAFLSPPVAMSAFYLKGVSPSHVTLNQIFAGMTPYMFIVVLCMVIMYVWPGLTLWLPRYLYGG
jgi:TRAP-type mannitol/chloroaromatic compound transport system permease large subunit